MSEHATLNIRTCAVGLDVGGTKIAGGVVARDTRPVLTRRAIATRAERGGAAVLEDALALASALCADARGVDVDVIGIGVGVPELVDQAGHLASAHAIDWRDLPVRQRFADLGPTVLEADVRAHALAEARYGAGRAYKLFTFVTVGTGISCCLVQDGKPYAGARGNALVLASSPLTTTCPECGAVLRPVLEEFAAGPALVARYNQGCDRHAARGEDVVMAAKAGDATARHVLRSAGEALGVSTGWLVNVLDPEALVVGGGLGLAGGLYWESFVAATRAHIWADASRDLPIVMAALGPDAGLIGAAATASV
jgi:glucokinase